MKNRIVILDDNLDFCEAMHFLFDAIPHFELLIYNNVFDFLKDHTHDWSGFLLMDWFIPGMDGITLLNELKARNNKMNIVVISGHADRSTIEKVKGLGANEFLTKPFNTAQLLEKISF